jgi:hypothetical protein
VANSSTNRRGRKSQPNTIKAELEKAGDRSLMTDREAKKNYAERLSRALAQRFADALRKPFPEILPDANGDMHESKARSAKGYKKLDQRFLVSNHIRQRQRVCRTRYG